MAVVELADSEAAMVVVMEVGRRVGEEGCTVPSRPR